MSGAVLRLGTSREVRHIGDANFIGEYVISTRRREDLAPLVHAMAGKCPGCRSSHLLILGPKDIRLSANALRCALRSGLLEGLVSTVTVLDALAFTGRYALPKAATIPSGPPAAPKRAALTWTPRGDIGQEGSLGYARALFTITYLQHLADTGRNAWVLHSQLGPSCPRDYLATEVEAKTVAEMLLDTWMDAAGLAAMEVKY